MPLYRPDAARRVTSRSLSTRTAVVLLAASLSAAALGCGPSGPQEGGSSPDIEAPKERFQFTRASAAIVRLDSSTGQMWFVPLGGQGGWMPLGDRPDPAGHPEVNGRYRVYSLEIRQRGMGMEEPSTRMLRLDGDTGRTWTIELLDGAAWVAIEEPVGEEGPAPLTASPEPAARVTIEEPVTADALGVISSELLASDDAAAAEFAHNLVQALEKDGMPAEVQAWSARQLGQFPREIAVPPLLEALESEHPVVVVAAIHALKETGDPSTIPMIQRLQDHPDPSVRAAVREVVVEVR